MSMRQRHVSAIVVGIWAGCGLVTAACIPGVGNEPGPIFEPPVLPPGRMGPPPSFETPRSADRPPPSISGGTLAVLSDGNTAVASDPDRDSIFVANYRTLKLLATLPLQPGDEPGRIAEDGAGRVHVALRRGGALVTLESKVTAAEPPVWSIVARRAICAAPRGVAYDKARDVLHVACAEGELVSLAPAPDGAVTRRLKLERDLRDVVVDGDTVLVSHFRSAEVVTLDVSGKVLSRMTPPAHTSQRFFKDPSSTPNQGSGGTEIITMEPAVGWRMIGSGAGETLLVHQRALVEPVSTQPGGYSGLGCGGGIVETAVTNVGVLTSGRPTPPLTFAVLPVDMAVSPDRSTYAIIAAGNARQQAGSPAAQLEIVQSAQIINSPENNCIVGMRGGVDIGDPRLNGGTPTTAGSAPADGTLPAMPGIPRQPAGEAVAVAYDRSGHILVQTRQPASIQIVTAGSAAIILSREDRTDTGHGVFHANSGGSLACASCHPEGGDDGRVWKFFAKDRKTIEPRRTQNLHGGVLATAPFHWSGDLKDVAALMDEVFVNRMGGPQLESRYIDVLKSWMDTMPALPNAKPADATAVERGRAVFSDPRIGCNSCHTPGLLTNNTTVDVGTGGKFQVPSLRGIGWRAPFMHNGCAKTLRDRFTAPCSGGDKHGVTSTLSTSQIDDLLAFMETF
ncbi:MAG TPA: cytochrome-c peroxidase [Polyangia bacterium]|jgi:mono/diheme cytochrome c family protein|nr:cytochrome-c peroxidase [Polyangia bacterium]